MRAKDVMTRELVTVTPAHGVRHATQIMLDKDVSGLLVVNDDHALVGIISEGDLLRRTELVVPAMFEPDSADPASLEHLEAYIKGCSWRVGDVMTRDVVTVDEGAPIGHLAALMNEKGIKRVPVLHEGKLVGVVSRSDLMRIIADYRSPKIAAGDEAIERAVRARIEDVLGARAASVTVAVSGGIVRLSGRVGTGVERTAARVASEGVPGVDGVTNLLRLGDEASAKGEAGGERPDDRP
ncbi:CBS domain-containing protein [Nitratireductor sp. ZSWI3]|uniref:CBS domain-containing protein n=1 Tax=Nitratireductor sp. ZSWI3 TaxID=2966359 RepID=UPI00215050A7|nr:CBS domain-containing protein [Nitratireductor sp. ZSWI3]MCR4264610.1 CBS domain-containing protein [Nitratireductor sp. ZSWI3]